MTLMLRRLSLFTLVFALTCVAAWAQQDPFVGTWKLNTVKSKQPNMPKSQINKLEAVTNGVKFTLDAENQGGKKAHQEYTAYFDGKFYPVKGDSNSDEVSRKRVDARHSLQIRRKNGKIVSYSASEVSADGKTYTFRLVDATGKPINDEFQVFDRQ